MFSLAIDNNSSPAFKPAFSAGLPLATKANFVCVSARKGIKPKLAIADSFSGANDQLSVFKVNSWLVVLFACFTVKVISLSPMELTKAKFTSCQSTVFCPEIAMISPCFGNLALAAIEPTSTSPIIGLTLGTPIKNMM